MKYLITVAVSLLSLNAFSHTLTCVETSNGYPTSRLMLEENTEGYNLQFQKVGDTLLDTAQKTIASAMTCKFAPKDKKMLSCNGMTNKGSSFYLSTKRVEETMLNDFFGMMTTLKSSFLDFKMMTVTDDVPSNSTMRFSLSSCKVQKDKTEDEDDDKATDAA